GNGTWRGVVALELRRFSARRVARSDELIPEPAYSLRMDAAGYLLDTFEWVDHAWCDLSFELCLFLELAWDRSDARLAGVTDPYAETCALPPSWTTGGARDVREGGGDEPGGVLLTDFSFSSFSFFFFTARAVMTAGESSTSSTSSTVACLLGSPVFLERASPELRGLPEESDFLTVDPEIRAGDWSDDSSVNGDEPNAAGGGRRSPVGGVETRVGDAAAGCKPPAAGDGVEARANGVPTDRNPFSAAVLGPPFLQGK
ncbi:hypothetical protein C8R45DRAFT_1136070, partial [Mycena sanguinolenta]